MCDVPKTYIEALASIVELESNYRRHEKSMATAKVKLDAAKAVILEEHKALNELEVAKIPCAGGVISIGKARKVQEFNDTYGHQLGDVRLIDVAKRLKEGVRETDIVVRLGGDEFAIILGELGQDRAEASLRAKNTAEKLCKSLSATACLKGVEHKTCQSDDSGKCRCSASIGVTLFSDNQLSPGQLLSQADAAMYQAKKAGGNRFQLYEANAQK